MSVWTDINTGKKWTDDKDTVANYTCQNNHSWCYFDGRWWVCIDDDYVMWNDMDHYMDHHNTQAEDTQGVQQCVYQNQMYTQVQDQPYESYENTPKSYENISVPEGQLILQIPWVVGYYYGMYENKVFNSLRKNIIPCLECYDYWYRQDDNSCFLTGPFSYDYVLHFVTSYKIKGKLYCAKGFKLIDYEHLTESDIELYSHSTH